MRSVGHYKEPSNKNISENVKQIYQKLQQKVGFNFFGKKVGIKIEKLSNFKVLLSMKIVMGT